jgi:coenzyme Q-binding protein COQ10
MPQFRTTRRVRHSAQDMFALVADVERYPEFVPFCESLVVRARRNDGDRDVLVAEMAVGYKLLRERFVSEVVLDRPAMQIRADYLDGPFRSLENLWEFRPHAEGGSEIRFSIAYEFRSRTLALVMGALFDRVFSTFADAFAARADRIYGRRPAASGSEQRPNQA